MFAASSTVDAACWIGSSLATAQTKAQLISNFDAIPCLQNINECGYDEGLIEGGAAFVSKVGAGA